MNIYKMFKDGLRGKQYLSKEYIAVAVLGVAIVLMGWLMPKGEMLSIVLIYLVVATFVVMSVKAINKLMCGVPVIFVVVAYIVVCVFGTLSVAKIL